jgi:hypothetical protein
MVMLMYLIAIITHDVPKRREHEEHLTHVFSDSEISHELRFILHVCFLLFLNGVLAFYAIQQVAQTGCLFCLG